MKDLKKEREELLKTKESLTIQANDLIKNFEQIKANLIAVDGALQMLDKLESEDEVKSTDTITKNCENITSEEVKLEN